MFALALSQGAASVEGLRSNNTGFVWSRQSVINVHAGAAARTLSSHSTPSPGVRRCQPHHRDLERGLWPQVRSSMRSIIISCCSSFSFQSGAIRCWPHHLPSLPRMTVQGMSCPLWSVRGGRHLPLHFTSNCLPWTLVRRSLQRLPGQAWCRSRQLPVLPSRFSMSARVQAARLCQSQTPCHASCRGRALGLSHSVHRQ